MVLEQVGEGGVVLEHLVGVRDSAGDEDRSGKVEVAGDGAAETLAGPQVDPGAHRPTLHDADQPVPRFGEEPARGAAGDDMGDVALHRVEVGQTERDHLGAMPIFLEPAVVVVLQAQTHDQQTRDLGGLDLQVAHRSFLRVILARAGR